ncbi:MAG: alanine--tRNA ligase [Actinobacteria bacterium]|nr:alanine--tRNA ligase [Actinomycetota bacterium]
MDSVTVRETFLRFFEERDHQRFPSSSLIPNDPTLLLTTAGMVQFKPYMLGDAAPPHPRATSFQKVARTTDIENVGRTTRHLTFFEMLGNFSFGDYFKRQAIAWAWELSVEHYELDPDRIWATVYEDDDESEQLWLEETDVPAERIQRLGAEDNFWWMHVAGPGGPNTELYYDRGPEFGQEGGPAVDDERYFEFYNLVFMQFRLDDEGNILGDLPAQNVDTGMGLERMSMLKQGVPTIYDTDVLAPMLVLAQELTGHGYGEDDDADVSLRVIAEHARTSAFLIADGVLPSKEGRGYVLRRLLRRAVRHTRLLGTDEPVMEALANRVIDTMRPGYPELEGQRELVTRVAAAEEIEFTRTLRQGLGLLDEAIAAAGGPDGATLSGDTAFKLHDTFGFPIDLTSEIVAEAGLTLDRDRFEELMQEQRGRARAAMKRGGDGVPVEVYRDIAATVGATDFLGYEALRAEADLGAIVTPGGIVESATEGDEVEVVLPRTPFYAEGGGQVGDRGILETTTGRLEVIDTQEPIEGLIVHRARVVAGEVSAGQPLEARVDPGLRLATARSHSATHVLHASIKDILGSHAQQAGSLVEPGRLRFDFPHFEQVPRDRLVEIEEAVNRRVLDDPSVRTEILPIDEAKSAGAVANFGDKYGQIVRVVTIGDFSKELCGGTHVGSGATIGTVHVVREESIGANTRRLEALTGLDALRYVSRERLVAEEISRLLDVKTDEAVARVEGLLERLKSAERELAKVRSAGLSQQAKQLADEVDRTPDGLAVVTTRHDGVTMDELRQLALEIRGHLATKAVVIAGAAQDDGKAQLVAVVSDDLASAGIEARPILQPAAQVVGGGAGGKGDLAQAGGKGGEALDQALEVAADHARTAIRDA